MQLRFYDTLTREKRPFEPLDSSNVRMYACGPTVYDFAHIGNGRAAIVFDLLFRVLRHRYGAEHVTYVRNITDVDDKINVRAARDYPGVPLNEAIRKVTEETYQQYQDDVSALGCLPPTVQPRATEHISGNARDHRKAGCRRLCLCRRGPRAVLAAGDERGEFRAAALWRAGKTLARRDDRRRSRRCCALQARHDRFRAVEAVEAGRAVMAVAVGHSGARSPRLAHRVLGDGMEASRRKFDIHGGGIDLVFPHHENELAQTCCAFHSDRMANVWMHNGFLQVESEKMSKSLGNFFTIRDLLADWPGEVLRLTMLKTHYRSPLDWTLKSAEESAKTLDDWYAVAADAAGGEACGRRSRGARR